MRGKPKNTKSLRARLRHAAAVLNGRSRRRGQSLVELTLMLPMLLIMLFGMIEIGWYANSYLILLDATREAGRYGSIEDPISRWQGTWSNTKLRHNCCNGPSDWNPACQNTRPEMGDELPPYPDDPNFGYFDDVACYVLDNLYPLEFKWTEDEVVVSVFAYTAEEAGRTPFERISPEFPLTGGRFPVERNRCFIDPDDPSQTTSHLGFTLTAVGNADCDIQPEAGTTDGCANHRRSDGCWGSEWDPAEIESRLYEKSRAGAIVLIEVFWWHEQLLGLPFIDTINNPSEIYVWAMFPVPAAEPEVDIDGGE
jgi:hypothetical protein